MADKDNIFTFDTTPFMNGLKKVTQGMGNLQRSAGNMAKNISRGVINAVAKLGLVTLAFKGIKAAINEMPEIGQTFKIAKNIIMKNLLFPLRKAVFPLLQKFLDWVRDNRAMFIKWGQALVNIFHSVAGAVKQIIEFGGRLAGVFRDFINKTFGLEIKNFQDLINVLTFRIAVVIEFLKALAEPAFKLFSKIADLVGTTLAGAFETLTGFIEGFFKGAGDIGGIFTSILDSITSIVSGLFSANKHGNSIQTVFKTIGEIFGKIVNFVLEITDSFLEGLEPAIKNIMTPMQRIADAFKSIWDSLLGSNEAMKGWKSLFKFLGTVVGTTLTVAFTAIAIAVELIDGAITGIVEGIRWIVENIENIEKGIGIVFKGVNKEKTGIEKGIGNIFEGVKKTFNNIDIIKLLQYKPFQEKTGIGIKTANKPFDDVIVTNDGKVVPVNNQDDIMSFKPGGPIANVLGRGAGGISVSIDFRGMQIIIPEATQAEAQKVGESLVETMRTELTREFERLGMK